MLLPLGLDVLHSLVDEFVKISHDAGTRATLAAKHGQPYLPGGELPSTTAIKMAKLTFSEPAEPSFGDKVKSFAHKAENPAISALKGAGGAILLGQLLTGGRLGGYSGPARLGYRGFGALGAGAGLAADHFGQKNPKRTASLPAEKTANMISETFSPARQLSSGVQTGSFKNMVHAGGRLRPPKVGQKFNFPSEPT